MSIVSYIPTPYVVVKKALSIANVGVNDVFYDLGAGDGRVVIEAAKRGAYSVAVEIDPYLCEVIKANALKEGVLDKISIIEASFFDVDLSDATVVYMYLYKSINNQLKDKLERELSIGARVITIDFPIPTWIPVTIKRVVDDKGIPRTIHVYVKGISNPGDLVKSTNVIDYKYVLRKIKCIRSV